MFVVVLDDRLYGCKPALVAANVNAIGAQAARSTHVSRLKVVELIDITHLHLQLALVPIAK